ncbi:MAG: flavodoxin domain-containing protein [Candidatus Dormibacteria bacterium]
MSVLVAYATRYGATRGIAERIAAKLTDAGQKVDVRAVGEIGDASGYDAFVIGSATYMGSWLRDARAFTHSHEELLSLKQVWLFSSGPLGTETTDAQGRDVAVAAAPKEFVRLGTAVGARDERVFFGALDRAKLRGAHRLIERLPGGSKLLVEGDFRDWQAVDAWAEGIAREVAPPAGPA